MPIFSDDKPDGRRPIGPDEAAAGQGRPPNVDAKFLLWAGGATLVAAAVCGYIALCLLFYQGQWQMVLHPEKMQPVPANALPGREDVHFFPDSSGTPQLHGWWIPARQDSLYKEQTLLYVPDGGGSLSSRIGILTRLGDLGRNVFVFDYRGFGDSAHIHPSEESLEQDAMAAVGYLTDTRHIPASKIAVYGNGTGTVPATYIAAQHTDLCCLVLDNARPTMLPVFQADTRTHMLPLHLLLKDEFNIMPLVAQAPQPKLIFASTSSRGDISEAQAVYNAAAGKKEFVDTYTLDAAGKTQSAVQQFLKAQLPGTTPALPAKTTP